MITLIHFCYFPTALVQPPLPITQETMKDVPFSSLVLPVGTVTSNLATPTLSAGSVFNPLPISKPESDEKGSHLTDLQISSSENNRAGKKYVYCLMFLHTINIKMPVRFFFFFCRSLSIALINRVGSYRLEEWWKSPLSSPDHWFLAAHAQESLLCRLEK